MLQKRWATDIATMQSEIFYHSIDYDPKAIMIKEFIKADFNISDSHIVLVNVKDSSSLRLSDGTKVNRKHAAVVGMIIKDAVTSRQPVQDIGCLIPYAGQVRVVTRCIMAPVQEQLGQAMDDLRILSFGGSQSIEFDMTVVDLVTTDGLGFLFDDERMLVGLTRGRFGLIVVANIDKMQKAEGYTKSSVGRFIRYCQQRNLVHNWSRELDTAMLNILPNTPNATVPGRKGDSAEEDVVVKKASSCFNCGSPDHSASRCTKEKVLKSKDCGKTGHSAKYCPTALCKRCGKLGHRKVNCTDEAAFEKCSRCGSHHDDVARCLVPTDAQRAAALAREKAGDVP